MVTRESLIFYTGQQPIQEMLSSVDPAALGPGQFALLDNLSISRNQVTARWGCERDSDPPEPGMSYRGSWAGYIAGNWIKLIAFRIGGETRIYEFASFSFWMEVTDSSNRFATDGMIDFAPVTDVGMDLPEDSMALARQDGVLCGNGEDEPGLVFYGLSGLELARISKPLVQDNKPILVQEIYPSGWFNICNGTTTSYLNATDFVGSNTAAGSTTENEIKVEIRDGAGVGDKVEVSVSGGLNLATCRMFHILLEDAIDDSVFNYINIEGYNIPSTTFHSIYNSIDSVGSYSSLAKYTPNSPNTYLASFDLSTTDTSNLTNISKFRLELRRKPPAARTFRILAFMAGGNVDAASEVMATFGLAATRVETPPVAAQVVRNPLLSNVGGTTLRAINVIQPSGTYWMNWLKMCASADTDTCDISITYRRDPEAGDADFYASYAIPAIATWFPFNCRPEQKDYARKVPSAFNVRPPKAAVLASGNNRLYAGKISGDKSRVMVSDEGYPMRFSSIPRDSDGDGFTDPDSGTAVAFPGEEVQKIINMPGSMVGVSPVAILTNRNIWRIEGIDSLSLSRPTLMSPHGTLYPRSVAIHKGNVYFLDTERQPRVLTGGYDAQPLGIWKIEDQLQDGDPTNAVAVVFREAYKLAYRAPGASVNRRVLNYEERLNGWHRHSYSDADWAGLLLDEVSPAAGVRLLGITDAGYVFEVEKKNKLIDDRKTFPLWDDITVTLKTGELHGDLWQSLMFGRVGLLCDKADSRVLTVTRTDPGWAANDGVAVGQIDCEVNVQDRAWRYDQTASLPHSPCGIKAQSCQVTITGAWTPGKNFRGLFIEVGPATKRPDVAA